MSVARVPHDGGSGTRPSADDALEGQFETVKELLYDIAGINLTDKKREMVRSRLARRMRAIGGSSVRDYVDYVRSPEGRGELAEMVDALTTNKTSFFRESAHFDFLNEVMAEGDRVRGGLTIWSAGCSSGEEPYTLAMLLLEQRRRNGGSAAGRVLATDISGDVLQRAVTGVYTSSQVEPVAPSLRQRYLRAAAESGDLEVSQELRSIVRFAQLNLMGEWPMRGPFDAIFCRNVMIYFDGPTKQRLVGRFATLLAPGGHLFVGHAESLSAVEHTLDYVQPAVYQKALQE